MLKSTPCVLCFIFNNLVLLNNLEAIVGHNLFFAFWFFVCKMNTLTQIGSNFGASERYVAVDLWLVAEE